MKHVWTPAALVAASVLATAPVGLSSEIQPDATLLQFPDVSRTHIVFAYANDLWLVPRDGGTAQKVASPPGAEVFPRFSPDGNSLAFMGNYEGGRDLYLIKLDGGNPAETAQRLTYHPAGEMLSEWTPDGESLIFSSSGMTGMTRAPQMFTVSADGGAPERLGRHDQPGRQMARVHAAEP